MNSVKDLQKEAGLTDDELEGIETDDDIEDSDDETEDEVEDTVPEDTNTSTTA
jgi:hypothetical protein